MRLPVWKLYGVLCPDEGPINAVASPLFAANRTGMPHQRSAGEVRPISQLEREHGLPTLICLHSPKGPEKLPRTQDAYTERWQSGLLRRS